jgi:hypothetical protein
MSEDQKLTMVEVVNSKVLQRLKLGEGEGICPIATRVTCLSTEYASKEVWLVELGRAEDVCIIMQLKYQFAAICPGVYAEHTLTKAEKHIRFMLRKDMRKFVESLPGNMPVRVRWSGKLEARIYSHNHVWDFFWSRPSNPPPPPASLYAARPNPCHDVGSPPGITLHNRHAYLSCLDDENNIVRPLQQR